MNTLATPHSSTQSARSSWSNADRPSIVQSGALAWRCPMSLTAPRLHLSFSASTLSSAKVSTARQIFTAGGSPNSR